MFHKIKCTVKYKKCESEEAIVTAEYPVILIENEHRNIETKIHRNKERNIKIQKHKNKETQKHENIERLKYIKKTQEYKKRNIKIRYKHIEKY